MSRRTSTSSPGGLTWSRSSSGPWPPRGLACGRHVRWQRCAPCWRAHRGVIRGPASGLSFAASLRVAWARRVSERIPELRRWAVCRHRDRDRGRAVRERSRTELHRGDRRAPASRSRLDRHAASGRSRPASRPTPSGRSPPWPTRASCGGPRPPGGTGSPRRHPARSGAPARERRSSPGRRRCCSRMLGKSVVRWRLLPGGRSGWRRSMPLREMPAPMRMRRIAVVAPDAPVAQRAGRGGGQRTGRAGGGDGGPRIGSAGPGARVGRSGEHAATRPRHAPTSRHCARPVASSSSREKRNWSGSAAPRCTKTRSPRWPDGRRPTRSSS